MAATAVQARQVRVEPVMGTMVTFDVRDDLDATELIDDAIAWLHHVDATFSTYRPDSAISRIGRGELAVADCDRDVRWIAEQCETLRERTNGYFDAHARGTFDPSALVKGWSVQRAADLLAVGGLEHFFVSAGGDAAARGTSAPGRSWRAGIQHPLDRGAIAGRIALRDAAIATSGAYERGAHLIDPHTGRAPAGVLSVTVVGPDLGTADAYATAAFAMGLAGPEWTLGLGEYRAMTILADHTVLSTPGFEPLS